MESGGGNTSLILQTESHLAEGLKGVVGLRAFLEVRILHCFPPGINQVYRKSHVLIQRQRGENPIKGCFCPPFLFLLTSFNAHFFLFTMFGSSSFPKESFREVPVLLGSVYHCNLFHHFQYVTLKAVNAISGFQT